MGIGGDYARKRIQFKDVSGDLTVASATDDTTLVTVRNAVHQVFIQKIHVQITTASSGKTWAFKDSAGTPVIVSGLLATDVAPATYDIDFGPVGVALTVGKNFLFDVSATGAVGRISWEAYERLPANSATAIASV